MDTSSIWHSFNKQIFQFIFKQVRDSEQAEDILQDVFVKIHLKLHTLSEREKLLSWVYSITRNTINDHFRSGKPHLSEEELETGTDQERHEFEQCLRPFVDQLAPTYREALLNTELGKFSQKEYARQINMPYSTVKSRVQRAKQQLHRLFIACCEPVFDVYGNVVERKKEQCACGCES